MTSLMILLQAAASMAWGYLGAAIGAGLATVGAARQPESSGDIRTSMIIAAALVEGVALLSVVLCLLVVFTK